MKPILAYSLSGRLFAAKAVIIFCFLSFISLHAVSQKKGGGVVFPTVLQLSNSTGTYGGTATFTALLQSYAASDNSYSPAASQPVSFSIAGTLVGTANTDNNGYATLTISLTNDGTPTGTLLNVGPYTIAASYGGFVGPDGSGYGSSASNNATLTVTQANTNLVLSNSTGTYGGSSTLTATLSDGNNNPVSGETVTFDLGSSPGTQVGTAATDVNGMATLTISLTADGTANGTLLNAGTYSIAASFAGDINYVESTSPAASLTVNPPPTISVTGAPSALSTVSGTASSSTNFSIAGTNLTPDNLTVTAPPGFDVSPDNSSWSGSGGNFTIAETGTLLSTPVHVRLDAGDAATTYLASTISISGGGASPVTVTIPSSTVTAPLTTVNTVTPGSTYSNTSTITFAVTFGAPVTGLSTSNFTLTTTGTISEASVASVSGSGSSYTVTVNTGSGDGTIGLNLDNATGLSPGISTSLPFAGGTTTIDKTLPTITVSSPSVSSIADGAGPVTYTVTYADANFNASTLALGDITLNVTGTAGGTLGLTENSSTSYTVAISGITGAGTLGISIAAGTASDLAGNLAPASGASETFEVVAPTISLSGAPSALSTTSGTASSSTSFDVSGTNLTPGNLTVAAPPGFDVSSNNSTWSGSGGNITIAETGTLSSTPVYVRLDAGDAPNSYLGTIAITGGGASPAAITLPSSAVLPKPVITSSGTPSAVSTASGTPSPSASFDVSGTNMQAGILVTPPTGFEVSTNNSTFSSSVTVGSTGTISSTPVYIRLKASDGGGSYSGNIGLTSTAATTVDVSMASSTVTTIPTTQVDGVAAPYITETSAQLEWANQGGNVATFIAAASSGTPTVINGTTYTASTTFGNGSTAGSGWYCVYNGGLPPNVTGLLPNTTYRVMALQYNGTGSSANYNTAAAFGNPINFTTLGPPSLNASSGTDSYSLNAAPINVDAGITASGGQSDYTTATVSITSGFQSGDALNFTTQNGITGSYNSNTGVLTLSGSSPAADYQNALESVTFSSTSSTTGIRTVSFSVSDGTSGSNTATKNINVTAQPVISTSGTLSALSTTSGTASSSTNFSISGSNLTPGNLTVTAPSGFDVSPDNSTWSVSGGNYTIAETVTVSATVYVRLDASDAVNSYSGNVMISGGGATTVTVSMPSSTVSAALTTINSITANSAYTNAATETFAVTFGAPVTGLSASNFNLSQTGVSGASVGQISGSGASYTVTVNTGTSDGTLGLNLANASGISPGVSNTLPFVGGTTIVDKTPPTITIGSPSVSSIADGAGPVTYSVTYADANFNTSTLALGDITLNATGTAGGTLGLTENSSTSYTVTISGITGAGTLGIAIAAGTASDLAGNLAPASGPSETFDVVTPTISLSGAPSALSTTSGTASSSTSFDVSGTNLTPGNLTVTVPAGFDVSSNKSTWSGSGGNITIAETGTLSSTPVYVRLDAGDAPTNYSGNVTISGGGASTVTVSIPSSTVSAALTTISGISANSTYSNAGAIQFTVTFGAPVTGLSTDNFSLTTTGTISGASISSVSSGTNSYTVTVNTGTGNGTIGLNLANATGLSLGISTSLPFTGGTSTIDKTPPTVSISAPSQLYANNSSSVTYTVTYSDANFATSTLSGSNITLNTTGTATGTIGLSGSGTSYTVTISGITGDGTLGISIAAGTASDLANNLAPASSPSATFTVDDTPPTVTIGNPSLSITNTGPVTYSVTYADANFYSSTLIPSNITLNTTGSATGTVGVSNTSATSYSVTISNITGNGTLGISIAAGTASDLAGNLAPASSPSATFTVNNTPPMVTSITASGANPTNATSLNFQVTFSEPVTGVATSDFTATTSGAISASGISFTPQSATVYDVTINSVSGNGTVRLDLNTTGATITDAAGNILVGGFTSGFTYTVQQTPPTVTSITTVGSSPNNASSEQFTVTFSESVSGVDASNFTLTNTGTVAGGIPEVSGSGTTYTVTIPNVTGDGTMRLDLNNAGDPITDAAGNKLTSAFTTGSVYTIEHTPPSVSSITATTPVNTSPTNATSVTYTVTFTEAVTGVAAGDFNITATNTVATTGISLISGTGTTYTVTISGITGDGTLRLDLVSGASGITDAAGNPASAGFTTGDVYTIEHTPPSVTFITATGATLTNATSAGYTVTFSEAVTGVTNSDFTASILSGSISTSGITVTPVSGSVYTVTVTGVSGNGMLRLDLNSSSTGIADLAGNPIASGFTTGDVYTIQQTPPSVTSITATDASPTHASSVGFTVTFWEAVTGVSASDFALTATGSVSGNISSVSGSGTTYTVTVNNVTGDGTLRLDLVSGASGITDAAGNAASAGFTTGDVYTIEHTPPSVLSITATGANPTNTTSVGYMVTFSEAVTGVTNSDFTATTGGVSSGTITVTPLSQSVYMVTVGGISGTGTLRLDLNSGTTIADLAGNAIAGGFTGGDVYTIDQTPLTLTLSSPTLSITNTGPVSYTVTYGDADFKSSTLTAANITLNKTGTATGTIGVSNTSATNIYTVTISGISGNGTMGISIAAGTASDVAGNIAPASGASATFTVDNSPPVAVSDSYTAYENTALTVAAPGVLSNDTDPNGYSLTVLQVNGVSVSLVGTVTATANGTVLLNANGSFTYTPGAGFSGPDSFTYQATDGFLNSNTATVSINVISTNASLSSLVSSGGALSPSFTSEQMTYTEPVSNTTTSITVTPTTSNSNAQSVTVSAGGITTTVTSGKASPAIALTVGPNIITITIKAQDGVTTDIYTLTVTRAPSSNANLANLEVTVGNLDPNFASGTTSYSASVSNATTSVAVTPITQDPTATVKVDGTTVSSGSASGAIPLVVGTNTITVVVTAQDNVTTKTYTVIITRAKSSNANLANLSISSGTLTPGFSTNTFAYTASVSNTTTSVTVTPTTSDPTATVTVNGTTVLSGKASGSIALAVGNNVIYTIVTAQDGVTVRVYGIVVTRAASAIATLSNLIISSGPLTPVFATGTTSYTVSVSNTTTSITVTPTTTDPTATVKVNGVTVSSGKASGSIALAFGKNTITTVVTAQNGTTTDSYTITVTRAASAIATLSKLTISSGTLTPAFATGTTSYTASVTNATTSITVTPTTSDPTATVKVNGTAVSSGSASAGIALVVGKNTITTVVTAQNGTTTDTYTVTVTRAASAIATLSKLTISSGTLTPAFATGTTSYTASVTNATTSIVLTPTITDPTATVKVNGTTVTSGKASGSIALVVGKNTINTIVTAQNGTTTDTYTVTVTRASAAPKSLYLPISVTKPADSVSIENDGVMVHQGVSPNGDGINDFLTIDGITAYPENRLMIISISGTLIFQAKRYDNTSGVFDGHSNVNGKLQQPGTYFYSLDYKAGNTTKHKTGYIILKY